MPHLEMDAGQPGSQARGRLEVLQGAVGAVDLQVHPAQPLVEPRCLGHRLEEILQGARRIVRTPQVVVGIRQGEVHAQVAAVPGLALQRHRGLCKTPLRVQR